MVTTDLLCRRVASACSWHIICYCTPQYNFLGKQTCQCTQLFLLSVNTYAGFPPNVLCGGKRSLPNWFPQLCCNKRSVCARTSWVQLNWSRCGWLSTSTTSLLCSMLCLSLNLISTVQHSMVAVLVICSLNINRKLSQVPFWILVTWSNPVLCREYLPAYKTCLALAAFIFRWWK